MPSYEETHAGWYTIGELIKAKKSTEAETPEGQAPKAAVSTGQKPIEPSRDRESYIQGSLDEALPPAEPRWRRLPVFPKGPLLRKLGRQLLWMCIVSIAPELGVAVAVKQWVKAKADADEAMTILEEQKRNGSLPTQYPIACAFYAAMGGIVIRRVKPRPSTSSPTGPDGGGILLSPPLSQANAAGKKWPGGLPYSEFRGVAAAPIDDRYELWDEVMFNRCRESPPLCFFSDSNLFPDSEVLRCPGLVSTIDEQSVADRGKSDAFTKAFAIAQSGWLVVSSLSRVRHGLAITELELATMAFIVCALIMYIFWWNKPFGAEERCLLVAVIPPDAGARDDRRLFRVRRNINTSGQVPGQHYKRVSDLNWKYFRNLVLDNDFTVGLKLEGEPGTVALYMSGMAFSAVHVAAWNWQFPSPTVKTFWRASSLGALAASSFPFTFGTLLQLVSKAIVSAEGIAMFGWVYMLLYRLGDTNFDRFFLTVSGVVLVAYVVCRLIILYLTFYCFTSMPSSVYEKLDWTGYIPHFS